MNSSLPPIPKILLLFIRSFEMNYNAFQINTNAKIHPQALLVLALTINIPYIAIYVVINSIIPQKSVFIG